jgi:hypothetical protein
MWAKEYRGDLGIALSDVYGMNAFLRDFDLYFCKLFDGARHDSGDPFAWGERMLEHYRKNRVDPLTKTLIFSDSLTVPRTIELYRALPWALPAGLRHRHQPDQRPGRPARARAAADRHQDDPLQRPAGGQAVRFPGKGMCDDENTWPTCARCSTSIPGIPLTRPPETPSADMDGSTLSVLWAVPFAGILLSIALMPLLAPISGTTTSARWRRPGRWRSCCLCRHLRAGRGGRSLVHALLAEYIPFVILLTALFTVAGGIYIRGNLHGSPGLNTAILAIGACWPASWAPRARPCC